MIDVMKHKHDVFALTDKKLGETDLVEYSVDMSDTTPLNQEGYHMLYVMNLRVSYNI